MAHIRERWGRGCSAFPLTEISSGHLSSLLVSENITSAPLPPLNKVTNCTMHCQQESSNNLSHNINIFSVAFSCLILYTAHQHNHSFLLAPGFQLTTHSFSLPSHLHKKPELFLLIRWLSILHSIQHQSPHSPAFGRSTWSCSHSSVGSTDLSNSVWLANLSLFTFFSRSHTVPPRTASDSRGKCKMASAQSVNYVFLWSQRRKLKNKSMSLTNTRVILYFINYLGVFWLMVYFCPWTGKNISI